VGAESGFADRLVAVTLALGIWYSISIGIGDFFGGYVTRRSLALTTVITALGGGVAISLIGVMVIPSTLISIDVALGAASGLTVGFALMFMYHGMALSSAAVVSPIVAVLAAVFPVGYDLSTGASLTGLVTLGITVAVVGLSLSTLSPELGDGLRSGIVWAIASGVAFGIALTLLGQTSSASGAWPALAQRVVAGVILALVATARSLPRLVLPGLRRLAVLSGVLGGSGVVAFALGAQRGSLSEIAVTSSMFPAVTAVLSAIFDGHPLRWWQMVGIGGCITGVAMIGVG